MSENLLSRAKVLIIDDEASNIRLLERILEMFGGAKARSTTDSREALRLYSEFGPDLILLDLHMPYLDGFAIIEQIKTVVPPAEYLPILVLTADVTLATKRRALTLGAKDILTKPLDHFEVVLRMNNLLENRFLHQELQRQNLFLAQQANDRTASIDSNSRDKSIQGDVIRQQRLSAFKSVADGLSRELQSAATMALGNSELLLPYLQGHASARELGYLHNILAAAQDVSRVVDRLGEFSRPAGQNEVRVPLDLNDIIQHVAAPSKGDGKVTDHGVAIEVRTELQELPLISGHAAELREVFGHLFQNSVESMPNGGSITIRTTTYDEAAIVTITDTGRGMTGEERLHCFEPFFTSKVRESGGFGLSIVHGIVERHGGSVEIASEKGQGTTVTVKLPAPAHSAMDIAPLNEELGRAMRILVVDRQEIICKLIADYLKSDGVEAVACRDCKAALELFQRDAFDLVIIDQSMPADEGQRLAGSITEVSANTPMILLNNYGEKPSLGDAHSDRVVNVSKPLSPATLRRAIHDAVSRPGAATADVSST